MNLFILSLSLIFLICIFLITGGTIMISSKISPKDIRFWWRILMIVTGVVIAIEAIIAFINKDTFFNNDHIPLSFRLIMEWFVIALLVSMIVVAGLRSKLSTLQAVFFPSIIVVSFIISLCYYRFNGTITPLHNWREIFSNFDKLDVRLRFILFLVSFISTSTMLTIPLLRELCTRKIVITKSLWIYIFFAILQPISYFLYALGNPVSGVILAIGCLLFVVIFSVGFIRNENPLIRVEDVPVLDYSINSSSVKLDDKSIYPSKIAIHSLSKFIKNNSIYLDKMLTIEDLSKITSLSLSEIISFYQSKGFSNFSDYISSFKLEHFKSSLAQNPKIPIAVIASDSGFTSRSGFYRYFFEMEKISPTVYKKNLNRA